MNADDFTSWRSGPPGDRRALVMGVLNVTPDSFSDGGDYTDAATASAHALTMIKAGADLIDIGGESTRPGSERVDAGEQRRRVIPVIERLARDAPETALSVDTTLSTVAAAALDHGATIINDISAGRDDGQMLSLAGKRGAALVLMHMLGNPRSMQADPVYADVVAEVWQFLQQRASAAEASGVARPKILIDPGIGFGKTTQHNLQLLRGLSVLADGPWPLVLGTSRKSFIGTITGEPEAARRIFGTAATVAWGVAHGAAILRVHDVRAMAQVARMMRAIMTA